MLLVVHRAPDLGDDALLGDVDVTQVQDVVHGLHLLHLNHPAGQALRGLLQNALPVRLRLCYDLKRKK